MKKPSKPKPPTRAQRAMMDKMKRELALVIAQDKAPRRAPRKGGAR